MKKISISIRFSLTIGFLIAFFSLISMLFTANDIKSSINEYESSVSDKANMVAEIMNNSTESDKSALEKIDADIFSAGNSSSKEDIKMNDAVINPIIPPKDEHRVNVESKDTTNQIILNSYHEDLRLINEVQDKVLRREALFCLLMGVIGFIISYPISKKLLEPFRELSSDIEAISASNLNYSLVIDNETDDLGKLKKSFNTMFERLNQSFEKQKRFSSNVAHELKTPLSVMKTNIQILDEDSDLEEYKEMIEIVEKNVDRMIDLVNDFVDYANDEPILFERVRIKETINDVLNELDTLIESKGIILDLHIKDIEIMSDEGLYKRLVYNLINNAISYNKDHGTIYIDANERELVVRDTGIGIKEDELNKIFEPLYCVDPSRSKEVGGSGLGLSIVKNICNVLNYKIEVTSKIGFGTEFIIKI